MTDRTQVKTADLTEIRRAIALLFEPGAVVELRALDVHGKVICGYFNNHEKLANEAARLSGTAKGVYVVLNQIPLDLLARSANRVSIGLKDVTKDTDVTRRRWLPIDVDANRLTGISSTNEEHQAALIAAEAVRAYLIELGFPADSIVSFDSGNGAHEPARIDLPNDDDAEDLIIRCLKALAAKFNSDKVTIDTSVFNASRIWKLPGTLAKKGDSVADRPHRLARVLSAPQSLTVAPREALERLAATAPVEAPPKLTYPRQPLNLEKWLIDHNIEFKGSSPYDGGMRYILKHCPFNPDHAAKDAAVFQRGNGVLGFNCFHNSCSDKKWEDFRELYEPGYKTRRHRDSEPTEDTHVKTQRTNTYPQASLDDIRECCQRYLFLPDTAPLEVLIGAVVANLLPGDPVWLLLVGPPGWGKTELLNCVVKVRDVHPIAVLTEASLLSGTPKRDAQGAKGGMLRIMGNFGILCIKDFGGILSLTRESRGPILAALREVYDGAWTRCVGSDGGRVLTWAGKAGLVGGATPTIDGHYAVMATLGERFAYFRIPDSEDLNRAESALAQVGIEAKMRSELSELVAGFFDHLKIPTLPTLSTAERDRLVALAAFTARCRSAVDRDAYQTREIQLIPGVESPTRLVKVLALLLRGLEVAGVAKSRAWDLVTKVALDSMPALRQRVIQTMLKNDSELQTSDIATALQYPTNTVRRCLEDLACYQVTQRESQGKGNADLWTLSPWTKKTYAAAIRTLPEILNREYTPEKGLHSKEYMNNESSISDKVTPPNCVDSVKNNGSVEVE